jgi:hypothetical protein
MFFAVCPLFGTSASSLNKNTYDKTPALALACIFISIQIAKLSRTQNVASIDPKIICQGASRSSPTFFDQFNFVFKQFENKS